MTERPSAEVPAAQAVSAASAPTGAGANVEVLVTGLGATTPLGGDTATTWQAMLDGKSGVQALTDDWATDLPVRIAAKLAVEPTEVIERVKARRMDRVQQVAVVAAREAWADAGAPDVDPERLAVVVGSGIGGALTLLGQWDVLREKGPRRVSPLTIPMLMPNGPAAVVGLEIGAKAAVRAPVSACATGAEAIAIGLELIRSGKADVVLAGGAEACIHPLPMAGFGAMRAMSTRNEEPERASRPFDKARDGFVLGEGGGMVVLERAEFARARGRSGYAVLAGAGITADGYDIVQPDPSGSGQARAVVEALQDGGLTGADIQHVNGHSTSTPAGDMGELLALQKAIGDHPVVTATKSMTGHLLGAAGAVEAIATVLSIRDGIVPPTINLENPDDGVCLDIAANTARKMTITAAINDSFGFGGHNVALAFRAL
ncbi:beta-ketoacyl-[acyl-carrier-protein] synthase family protein [Cryptosporangium sp. NPDC048952]|uniref:beta-ketoacyl-[acyl-carrier-protein] synthase family protein n=1 Tax=Cryptosporangium sp. NPDC048952 TaxID=3363961 RepID=UPI00370F7D68